MKTLEDLFFGKNIPYDSPSIDPEEYRRLTAGACPKNRKNSIISTWTAVPTLPTRSPGTHLCAASVSACGFFWNP